METGKFGLTLFDILGYLFPGYILLFGFSLLEATFFSSSIFSFQSLSGNIFFFTIAAYFFGHICHILSSLVKNYGYRLMSKEDRLNRVLYEKFKKEVCRKFKISTNDVEKLSKLDLFLLADNYIVSRGMLEERNSLAVREGFHKSSAMAFGILFLIIFCAIFAGGLKFQNFPEILWSISVNATIAYALIAFSIFLLFVNRYVFYNRLKVNSIYLLFLATAGNESTNK